MLIDSDRIKDQFLAGARVLESMAEIVTPSVQRAAERVVESLRSEGKVLLCGNGGSAADSQHIAAEFVGRFRLERQGFSAIALTTDTSVLTSLGNDYGFEDIFRRQVESLGRKGDILIGLSTSGKSKNILRAFEQAARMELVCIAFLGQGSSPMAKAADISIQVPSTDTPRIQEGHCIAGHILCDLVESALCDGGG